jgi:hypothetical protein
VRLITRHGERFVFLLGPDQAKRLRSTLGQYPLLPDQYQRISREPGSIPTEASQPLLDQSLAEHRATNANAIRMILKDPLRFRETPSGTELWITPTEADQLLQALNDIRVGSWVKLGSPPQPKFRRMAINAATAPHFLNLLACDEFMGPLLEALLS